MKFALHTPITYTDRYQKEWNGYMAGETNDGLYLIMGFHDDTGCVWKFNPKNVTYDEAYKTYRFVSSNKTIKTKE